MTERFHGETQPPTRSNGHRNLRGAHRDVRRTQEELELFATTVLDKWGERLQREIRIRLQLVTDEVRERGLVVPYATAQLYPNGLTGALDREIRRP